MIDSVSKQTGVWPFFVVVVVEKLERVVTTLHLNIKQDVDKTSLHCNVVSILACTDDSAVFLVLVLFPVEHHRADTYMYSLHSKTSGSN